MTFDDTSIAQAQEASLRSMAALFGKMETPLGSIIASDLKDQADRMKWCGERLPDPLGGMIAVEVAQ